MDMILSHLISKKIEETKKNGIYRKIADSKEILSTASREAQNSHNRQSRENNFINLATNDYLGLAGNKRVKTAAIDAVNLYGTSSSSSFLIYGHTKLHDDLEKHLCNFKGGYDKCLLFPSGFQANGGVIKSLAALSPLNTFIAFDELSHASIIDGIISSGAMFKSFRHNDLGHLEKILSSRAEKEKTRGVRIIITEGLFSMDGDIPDLPGILYLAEKFDAACIVDDAHATGTIGKKGGGSIDFHNIGKNSRKPDIIIGTLGKALASHGAFVLSDKTTSEYLINFCRSFIFSTGIPPSAAAASLESLNILSESGFLVRQLKEFADYSRKFLINSGFDILDSTSHIIPVLIGDEKNSLLAEKRLLKKGIYVKAIRYPSVARKKARLRLSLNSSLTVNGLEYALNKIRNEVIKTIKP